MAFDKLTGVEKKSPNCRFDTLPVVKFDKLKGSLLFLLQRKWAGRSHSNPDKGLFTPRDENSLRGRLAPIEGERGGGGNAAAQKPVFSALQQWRDQEGGREGNCAQGNLGLGSRQQGDSKNTLKAIVLCLVRTVQCLKRREAKRSKKFVVSHPVKKGSGRRSAAPDSRPGSRASRENGGNAPLTAWPAMMGSEGGKGGPISGE